MKILTFKSSYIKPNKYIIIYNVTGKFE